MKKEEILFLDQLVRSLEEAERSFEEAYKKRNFEDFNKTKKIMIRIQKEISGILQ